MTNSIIINPQGRNKISVITTPKNRIQVSSKSGISAGGSTTFRGLSDVDATDADNNETVVYDETTGKFVVKELPVLNGGTF